jgi:hypothetical protein
MALRFRRDREYEQIVFVSVVPVASLLSTSVHETQVSPSCLDDCRLCIAAPFRRSTSHSLSISPVPGT